MKIKLRCPKGHGKTVGMEAAGTDVKCDECDHVWKIPAAPTTGPEGEIMALTRKVAATEAELEKARAQLLAKDAEIDGLHKELAALRAKHRAEHPVAKTTILPSARADFLGEATPAGAAPKDGPAPKAEPAKAEPAKAEPAKAEEGGPPNLSSLRDHAKKLGRPEGVKTTMRLGDDQKAALMAEFEAHAAEARASKEKESKDAAPAEKAAEKAEPPKAEEIPPDLKALRERAKKQPRAEGVQRTQLLETPLAALLSDEKSGEDAASRTSDAGKSEASKP